jgi:hypothetical protein
MQPIAKYFAKSSEVHAVCTRNQAAAPQTRNTDGTGVSSAKRIEMRFLWVHARYINPGYSWFDCSKAAATGMKLPN